MARKALQAKMFFGYRHHKPEPPHTLGGPGKARPYHITARFEGILHAKIIPGAQIRYVP
jgi:hypothetical protein